MSNNSSIDQKQLHQKRMIRDNFIGSRWGLISCVLISLFSVVFQLLNPWPLKILLDSVFGNTPAPLFLEPLTGTYGLLIIVVVIYIGLYLIEGVFDIIDAYVTTWFTNRLSVKLQTATFNHIMNLPLETKAKIDNGDYVYRLNELTDNLPSIIFSTSVSIIANTFMMIGALVILATFNWQMAIIGGLIVPLLYLSIRYFTPRIGDVSDAIAEQTGVIYNESSQSIENTTLIQSFNRQTFQTSKFNKLLKTRARKSLHFSVLDSTFSLTNNVCTAVGTGIVLLIGGTGVFNNTTTIGELIVFVTYMSYLYDPIESILSSIGDYKSLLAGTKLVNEIESEKIEEINPDSGIIPDKTEGHIVFQNIGLKRGDRQILDNVNFEILPGQKVAFVGPSGSGKSTILSFIPRFAHPTTGSIYIDGQEIQTLNLAELRNQIGIVLQNPELLSGTIHENIGFAIPDEQRDLPAIMKAAESANATEFINQLPDGFETELGEGGGNLSGGQKQRISIARAYVKDPPILLLDEPTSALDTQSSAKIITSIKELMVGKTVLLATHETALLKEMDKVYLVNAGHLFTVPDVTKLDAFTAATTPTTEMASDSIFRS